MTLSRAEWRAVRPDRLKDLNASRLMETLRKPARDTIEDWQDRLETCDALQRVLERTPRMLRKAITPEYARALAVWYGDLDDIRSAGKRALDALAMAYLDDLCAAHGAVVEAEARTLIATVEAQMRRDRRKGAAPDAARHADLQASLAARAEMIRVLRRQRMAGVLREDRMAQAMIRGKHVHMRRFRMRCDGMLKALQKELGDLQKAHGAVLAQADAPDAPTGGVAVKKPAPRRRRAAPADIPG